MSTSLSEQLKKLQAPQTQVVAASKKGVSILFDEKEARNTSIDTAYDLGLEGLDELIKLEPRFKEFKQLLFNETAKRLQRAVQTEDVNAKLDGHIRKFLLLLSPHMMLKPALTSLEWLVRRFQIGEYNAEDLILTTLPYHGTRTFVLILRAVPCIMIPTSHWYWLRNVPTTGTPLDVHSVHIAMSSNPALIRLLCEFTLNAHKTYPPNEGGKLQTMVSFCCASMLGVMSIGPISQPQVAAMLPLLQTGLGSTTSCLVAGCLVVVTNLVTRAALKERITQELIAQLLSVRVTSLRHEAGSVLLLLFIAQQRLGASPPTLPVHLIPKIVWLPQCLEKLSQPKQDKKQLEVLPLVLAILNVALPEVSSLPSENAKLAASLISDLLDQVSLSSEAAKQVIRLMFDKLPDPNKNKATFEWFKEKCNLLETKYAEKYDEEARRMLELKNEDSSKLIAVMGILAVEIEKGKLTTPQGLLQRLVHPEESIRAAAVNCLGNIFLKLQKKEQKLMVDAVKDRLADDSMKVVLSVLQIPCLAEIVGGKEELCEVLIELLDTTPHKAWSEKTLKTTLALLCDNFKGNGTDMKSLCTLLAILPHIVNNAESLFSVVVKSEFGKKCSIIQDIKKGLEKNSEQWDNVKFLLATQKALQKVPQGAFNLVTWRLEKKHLSLVELFLLCRMLAGAARQLNSAEHALQCVNHVISISKRATKIVYENENDKTLAKVLKGKLPSYALTDILLALVSTPLSKLCPGMNESGNNKKSNMFRWCDLTQAGDQNVNESALKFCAKLLPFLLYFCSRQHKAKGCDDNSGVTVLHKFLQVNVKTLEQQLHLLCLLQGRGELSDEDTIRCLRFTSSLVQQNVTAKLSALDMHTEGIVIPTMLMMLSHKERQVRQATLDVLNELAMTDLSVPKLPNFHSFILAVISRDEEILTDEGHLSVLLFSLLSLDPTVNNPALRTQQPQIHAAGLSLVLHCTSELTPPHVKLALLRALRHVRTDDYLVKLAPLGSQVLSTKPKECQLDTVSWEILQLILERIDESTAHLLNKQAEVGQLLNDALKSTLMYQEQNVANVALSFMNKDMFSAVAEETRGPLLSVILSLGSEHASAVSGMLRRVVFHGSLVAEQLKLMAPPKPVQPRRSRVEGPAPPEPPVTSTEGWVQGLVLLEALQDKKKLVNMTDVVPILFHILKICMECEQEYAKQLVLGSLNNCLKYVDSGVQSRLDVELIVQCLRGTNNPHTQHQALMLLSQIAHSLPDNLLHHLVSVFTFMGSLVMRHDDTYSFQVIAEVINKVVPVIVQSQQCNVAVVLRVFVDAMPDIPAHRRAPIFTRLMNVLGWQNLWLFLALVIEGKVVDKKSPRLLCALELTKECKTLHLLEAFNSVIIYLGILATIKYADGKHVLDGNMIQMKLKEVGAAELQNPTSVSGKETRRVQITGLSFLSDLLASRVSQAQQLSPEMEGKYQQLLETLMSYLKTLAREELAGRGTLTEKFWPAMLHHAYAVLNKVNMLLPTQQFLGVVRGVLDTEGGSEAVKSKTLELLGARLQLKTVLSVSEREELLALVPTLKSLVVSTEPSADKALYCLRIMARQLAGANSHIFMPVITSLMDMVDETSAPTLLANSLLCLAELCSAIKSKAVPNLPMLVPLVLASSARHRKPDPESSELVVLAACAAMQRLVDTLPLFLSPFLPALLRELSLLSVQAHGKMSNKAALALQPKLSAIRDGLGKVSLRILLPAVHTVFDELCESADTLPALAPLLQVLSSTFANLDRTGLDAHMSEITDFFQTALELRSQWDSKIEGDECEDLITAAENEVISSLVSLVLKLPEGVFRPLYFKLSTWSSQAEQQPKLASRCITFFRCSSKIAGYLKSLFVVFAFYFLKQAAGLLLKCHSNSKEAPLFSSEKKSCLLLESVLETLLTVCSHDKQNFVNKEFFDSLLQPLVDQLENMLGGDSALRKRCSFLVAPCLAQFAKATADDVLWKQLNYQILLKTRHATPTVRLLAVSAVKEMTHALGEEFLPLLPEAVPFLAELLEDEEDEVEKECQNTVREMEQILGEPLQKYF